MRVEVVTSCSPSGYRLYGQTCVQSFLAHWPVPIQVYLDAPMRVPGIRRPRLTTEISAWASVAESLPWRNRQADKPESFLWNAHRYAVKPFVWHDAAKRMGCGILAWLDADTVTTSPVPDGLIETMLGDADVAYLGRGRMHPENGLVIFRVPEALPLLAWCRKVYLKHRYQAWKDGWTDCHALRHGLAAVPTRARDLTSHLHDDWRSSVDAFALSPLGPYVDHLKGPRQKREGLIVDADVDA